MIPARERPGGFGGHAHCYDFTFLPAEGAVFGQTPDGRALKVITSQIHLIAIDPQAFVVDLYAPWGLFTGVGVPQTGGQLPVQAPGTLAVVSDYELAVEHELIVAG